MVLLKYVYICCKLINFVAFILCVLDCTNTNVLFVYFFINSICSIRKYKYISPHKSCNRFSVSTDTRFNNIATKLLVVLVVKRYTQPP